MTDQLEELESLLPQLGPAIERRRMGNSLVHASERLRDSSRQIDRLKAILDIADQTDFGRDRPQAESLRELLQEAVFLAGALETAATAEDLSVISASYADLLKSLSNAERQLRAHWSRLADAEFRPLQTIGELLQQLGVAGDLGRRMADFGRQALSVGELAAPAFRDAILTLRRKRLELDRERAALTGNLEVDAFLDALATGRATLVHITEGVRTWLAANDALSRFAVRPTA